jgi:hypothetical protein
MADAVYGARMPESQPQSETKASLETGLLRLEHDLTALQSAAAALSDSGRAVIDQIKVIKTNAAAPRQSETELRLSDAAAHLHEIDDFLHCVLLASMSVEDRSDRDGLSAVLGHALLEMHKLSQELRPDA